MYRFFISVLETILDKFHYSALKNEHFFVVQKPITSHQRGNLKTCTSGLFPWTIAFKWHQACISSTIIPPRSTDLKHRKPDFREPPSKVRKWLYSHNVSFYNNSYKKSLNRAISIWIENLLLQETGIETESWKKKWFNLNPPFKLLFLAFRLIFTCFFLFLICSFFRVGIR